ncbi:putative baseplate assembly protein [Mycobacterium sp. 852013-50091_SCH5140682]|uniref:putative baseplate assembly protein n=1 Tax=Mycobacterium sp. 852013-50091_SCH5140682 TaxID=1834109 RepID=UPI0007EAAC2F|nr:putative baseplate assembly protein [Mycobacterium sp. 852013-50091_SCH5140682]OBC00022.1 putative baseplate assembly protein [Mycobacterium sp. 852013-50091_SCH5140682]
MSCCTCGCCDGVHAITPADTYNPPQRDAIDYRIGTYAAFRESMQARLSAYPALSSLATRDSDDPSIALLDCFAVVADILTFYQERIANEGYLRTATEPRSLAELGKLVGYRARPALGATTYLAYTLDPGAKTLILAGSGAKSVPRQNELPQTFETSEDLAAREEWNNLTPAVSRPPAIRYYGPPKGHTGEPDDVNEFATLNIAGTTANLRAGDRLLFLFDPDPTPAADNPGPRSGAAVRIVNVAKPDFASGMTAVSLVSKRTAFADALAALDATVNAAIRAADDLPAAASIIRLSSDYLEKLAKTLEAETAPTVNSIFSNVLDDQSAMSLPDVLDHLIETSALASVHESPAVVQWYTTYLPPLLAAARHVIALAEAATGRTPGEIDAIRWRAHDILCPDEKGGFVAGFADVSCDDGAALVGLTPMLPWLRRPPSQPPRRAREADTATRELFRPDSDVHAKLLAAADPRIAPSLHLAWRNEHLTPAPALSNVQVMRIKATLAAGADVNTVVLDTVYDGIAVGSWIILGADQVCRVVSAEQTVRSVAVAAAAPALSVPATVLTLDMKITAQQGDALYAQGESLTPVGDPITDDIAGDTLELDRVHDGLTPGRWLVVSGERTDVPYTTGVHAAELTMVAGVRQHVDPDQPAASVRTILTLTGELSYRYRRDSVTVYGNVVAADQGETRNEVLGSADASLANQSFAIRQVNGDNPLTALPASNPTGFDDALRVTVGGVRWQPAEILADASATDHVYRPAFGTDKTVAVQFGDGVHGARPPSGNQNIAATLRLGAGRGGNVVAGQISELSGRPLGVNAVTNPLPATGGADGDGPDDARVVTPLRMLALDRLLSVGDYEDYTRARAGIGKASARRLFDGRQEVVHVTVAGVGDVPIDPESGLLTALADSLTQFGDPGVTARVAVRAMLLLVLRAGVKVKPDYSWDLVEPAVRAALLDAFSFARRDLAQDAYLSEAFAAAQAVPGVDYVDIDVFHGIPATVTPLELISLADQLGPDRVVHTRHAEFQVEQFSAQHDLTLSQIAVRTGLTVEELCQLNPTLTVATVPANTNVTTFRGIRPAEIVVLPPDVPEALMLRRIP